MSHWLEYRLDRLVFQGGRSVAFPGDTRMLYNPTDNVIAVETTAAKRQEVKRQFADRPELKRIEYTMLLDLPGAKTSLRFFHPLKPGADVRLVFNDRGELFFMNERGRSLFSKDYTVRDVSRGSIDSDRAVWQFHGYKHEH